MGENKSMPGQDPPAGRTDDVADPDELMGDVSKLSFLKVAVISLLAHAVLIGATSVEYIQLCVEHQTIRPWIKIQEIDRKAKLEKLRKDREAAQKQLIEDRKKAAKAAGKGKDKGDQRPDGGKDKPEPKGGEPAGGNGGTEPKNNTPGVKDGSGLDLLGDPATDPESP